MNEFMYDINTALIAALLFISMAVAMEAGYRIGLGRKGPVNEDRKTHINAIQAAILGILALLLGFTFSLSLQRFDSRSEAVVNEANAIGTAWLRAQLLPIAARAPSQDLLRRYLDLRVEAGAVPLDQRAAHAALLARAADAQASLWAIAAQAADAEPNTVRTGMYITSLNEMIDSFGRRDAALNRHVPEAVLLLVFATFLMAGAIVGFSSGVAGHRPSLVAHIMVALIVVLVFVILDLDRPRRGLIEVSQKSLVDLQAAVRSGGARPAK
jgi:uncharacterized membrane protein (Fun14 family)